MKTIKLFAYLMFLFLCFSFAETSAQGADTTKTQPPKMHVVVKNDGTEFIGVIISQDAREVLIETKKTGQVYIPKHEIREIRELKAGDIGISGEYIPSEVFSTRYFITTNGLPIEKGEHYILWNLYGPDFQFGVGKNFGVGIMTSWLAMPVIGSAKYSINLSDDLNIGVGTLVGTGSWVAPDYGIALPFAAITYGNRKTNINFTGGYGAVFIEGDSDGRFLCSVAAMSKVGKKFSLVFDSFIMPPGGYKTETRYTNDPVTGISTPYQVKVRRDGFALLVPGVRWQMEDKKAFQFGFGGLVVDGDLVPVPIPVVQWFRKI